MRDHPRVCGEHFKSAYGQHFDQGSSPRMRGTPQKILCVRFSGGIIPAYAGNTVHYLRQCCMNRDHPRVCGEHPCGGTRMTTAAGSSPRMRGTPTADTAAGALRGIIPAYAGNTYGVSPFTPCALGSSPRMRGTHNATFDMDSTMGIIPAYAGNTLRDYSNFVVSKFMSFVFHLV